MMPNGWLNPEFAYYHPYETELMGVSFNYTEENVKSMHWLGYGPYRGYKYRMKVNTLNVWEKDYNNTVTGKSGFVYPENNFSFLHGISLIWIKFRTAEKIGTQGQKKMFTHHGRRISRDLVLYFDFTER